MKIDGVAAIVTGGASGPGAGTARRLAAAGVNPMLHGETIRLDGAIRMAPK